MTQKELLYVEDAILHEGNMIGFLEDAINTLEDKSLVTFVEKEMKKHVAMRDKLTKSLEVKASE